MSKPPQGELFGRKRRVQSVAVRERREAERKAQAFQRSYVALLPKAPAIKPEDKR